MRIWDISPAYLNRQSLLGEHRELHGLYNILSENKKGYSRHPETLRWVGAISGLVLRHAQLAAEMRLRGYVDRTPLDLVCTELHWPVRFLDAPSDQFELLEDKYRDKEPGRISLPRSAQELWAQHKYSMLSRDPERYRQIGRGFAKTTGREAMDELAREFVFMLRRPPPVGRLENALDHMWGHVRKYAATDDRRQAEQGSAASLTVIQALALRHRETFLLSSTALSEFAVYIG